MRVVAAESSIELAPRPLCANALSTLLRARVEVFFSIVQRGAYDALSRVINLKIVSNVSSRRRREGRGAGEGEGGREREYARRCINALHSYGAQQRVVGNRFIISFLSLRSRKAYALVRLGIEPALTI